MRGKNEKILSIIVLAAMVASVGFSQQAAAEYASYTLWMNIANAKTGTVNELKFDFRGLHFQKKILMNLDDLMVKKIRQIFGTDKFQFNRLVRSYEAKWHQFNVAIGINHQLGTNLNVAFAEPSNGNTYFIQRDYRIVDFVTANTTTTGPSFMLPIKPLNSAKIIINSNKNLYREGEKAIIYIAFVDDHDRFVDPDKIGVNLNVFSIIHLLEKKKTGSYAIILPPLGRGNNTMTVAAQKATYDIEPSSINITVLPKIPAAWPQT